MRESAVLEQANAIGQVSRLVETTTTTTTTSQSHSSITHWLAGKSKRCCKTKRLWFARLHTFNAKNLNWKLISARPGTDKKFSESTTGATSTTTAPHTHQTVPILPLVLVRLIFPQIALLLCVCVCVPGWLASKNEKTRKQSKKGKIERSKKSECNEVKGRKEGRQAKMLHSTSD